MVRINQSLYQGAINLICQLAKPLCLGGKITATSNIRRRCHAYATRCSEAVASSCSTALATIVRRGFQNLRGLCLGGEEYTIETQAIIKYSVFSSGQVCIPMLALKVQV